MEEDTSKDLIINSKLVDELILLLSNSLILNLSSFKKITDLVNQLQKLEDKK
jgi:hypothetical protein